MGRAGDVYGSDAADVDDPRRIVGGTGAAERRQQRLHEPERRLQVEVDDRVPGFVRERLQRLVPHCARIVDEDVELPGFGCDKVGEALTLVVPGQIGGHGPDVAVYGQLLPRVSVRFCVARADDHAGTRLEEPARDHHPDSPGAAGDEGSFTTEPEKLCLRSEFAVYNVSPSSLVGPPAQRFQPDVQQVRRYSARQGVPRSGGTVRLPLPRSTQDWACNIRSTAVTTDCRRAASPWLPARFSSSPVSPFGDSCQACAMA